LREIAAARSGRHRPSALAAAAGGLRDALGRPGAVLALLALNLVAALAVAAPVASVLSAELDRNLYGETMAGGASWRWFDTVDREHPVLLGDLAAWHALLSDEGVTLGDLAKLSGLPLALAVAGLGLYWLNALFHTGWLAALWRQDQRFDAGGSSLAPGTAGAMLAGAARFAVPATVITVLAAAGYAGVYALAYVWLGRVLDGVGEASQREWVSLGLTWLRLTVTLFALLAVKLWSDLAKTLLVERGAARPLAALPGALVSALGELLRRAPAYVTAYLALALGTPLLAALWRLVAVLLEPATLWPILVVLVLAQQIVVGARICLRLAHLAATRRLVVAERV
jgi:hypothetical protein